MNALCPAKGKTPMCETQDDGEFINELTGKHFADDKEMYAGVAFPDAEDTSDIVCWLGTGRAAGKFNGRDAPWTWAPCSAEHPMREERFDMTVTKSTRWRVFAGVWLLRPPPPPVSACSASPWPPPCPSSASAW